MICSGSLVDRFLRRHLAYCHRYGFEPREALFAAFWWRVEHVGYYRGGDGGLCGLVRRLGYRQRKAWERRGVAVRDPQLGHPWVIV